jgi:carbon-monoxide dehydrogenase medium subunit
MRQQVRYYAPESVEEALAIAAEWGSEARFLAGGQDLMALVNKGVMCPRVVVDLARLGVLRGIVEEEGEEGRQLRVGACTAYREIEASGLVREHCSVLAETAAQIGGGIQVRNRGTIGGAVCAGNPAYDCLPVLLVLGARFQLARKNAMMQLRADEMFSEAWPRNIEGWLLTNIFVPVPSGAAAFVKLKFTEGCYPIASAACQVKMDGNGRISELKMALGAVARWPLRLSRLEQELVGRGVGELLGERTMRGVEKYLDVPVVDDVQADGWYRKEVAGVLMARAFRLAVSRAKT